MSTQDASDNNGRIDGKKEIQKRTFTRWINVYLSRHDPPAEVCDLFQDIQDGRILMMLLEELTGCKLLYRFRSSSHPIFRLNNISKALAFLDDRHVKLLGIDASALADGVPSVVLNLIWNIILHFQVKEMTGGLHRRLSSSLSSLSMGSEITDESAANPGRNTAKGPKYSGKTIKSLLRWVQRCTVKFGVEVHDFGKSWKNGLAFLALIKSINPDLVDLRQSLTKDPEENLGQAFRTAHQHLDIPPLLEPQDVTCCPDEKSIITYVSMFLRHCPDMVEDLSTAASSPNISKFRSLETLADREEAQSVFSDLETSHELLLWKRWARRSSNSAPPNKRKSSSSLQPPSPLDAYVANAEIRSWLAKSSDHGYTKTKNNEIRFSLSSEEGIYSVTPLDSDEEDAYSYILELNNDVSQMQAKRQVLRVEEETEDTSLINEKEQAEMSGLSGDAESEAHIHDKDLNGDCKEKFANTKQKRIKEMQNVAKEKLSKRSLGDGLKSETFIELSPQKIMDLEEEEGRTERKARLETGYSKKHTDDLYFKDKTNNQLQIPNVSIVQKAHEDKELRNTGKSATIGDSFIENFTEDMDVAKGNNAFDELRHREKVVGEAGPSTESKRVSGDVSVTGVQIIPHRTTFHSYKKHRESAAKCNHEPSITASERGVPVKSVAPSSGLNRTELQVMFFIWVLLYCYFIGQQIISH